MRTALTVVAQDLSGEVATIGEAVALARDGDTIVVKPGIYPESVTIDKDITVAGEGDPSAVVIEPTEDASRAPSDGADARFGLHLVDSDATVSDLTVRGFQAGMAVVVDGGAPTLDGIIVALRGDFTGATPATPHTGLAIGLRSRALVRGMTHQGYLSIDGGAAPTIEDSQLVETCLVITGAGTSPVVQGNTIVGCPSGWGISVGEGATPTVEDNDVSGGGFDVNDPGTNAVIHGNRIHDWDRGIDIGGGATATIEGNDIFANGHGIGLDHASPLIQSNRIHDNTAGVIMFGRCRADLRRQHDLWQRHQHPGRWWRRTADGGDQRRLPGVPRSFAVVGGHPGRSACRLRHRRGRTWRGAHHR